MAEGRYHRVVVRSAPFSEKVRKTVDKHRRAGPLTVLKKQLLPGELRFSVPARSISADKRRLNRAGKHHRTPAAAGFKLRKQVGSEPGIAGHELTLVLRAVHPGKVEDEIRTPAVLRKLIPRAVYVVLKNLLNNKLRPCPVLAVAEVLKRLNKIPPDKSCGTGHKYLHFAAPFFASSSFMY